MDHLQAQLADLQTDLKAASLAACRFIGSICKYNIHSVNTLHPVQSEYSPPDCSSHPHWCSALWLSRVGSASLQGRQTTRQQLSPWHQLEALPRCIPPPTPSRPPAQTFLRPYACKASTQSSAPNGPILLPSKWRPTSEQWLLLSSQPMNNGCCGARELPQPQLLSSQHNLCCVP